MALLEFSAAYKEKRATRLKAVKNRKPLAVRLGEILAVLITWLSPYILPVLGLGSLTYAAFLVALPLGLVAVGISCFLLDYWRGS